MRCKGIIAAIAIIVSLSAYLAIAQALDDDWIKLQDQKFKLQLQLQDQQLRRIKHAASSYTLDFVIDASLHGISWTPSTRVVIPGLVKTFSDMGAVLHTAGLQTVLSHNRMHWTALTSRLDPMIGISGETQLMLPLRWHGRGMLPDWYQPSLAEAYMSRISRITQPVLTIALTVGSAAQTFLDTAQYIGRSMQVINPLMPETRITFPGMDLKPGYTIGEGLHNLKTWATDLATNRMRPVQFETARIIPIDSHIDLGNSRITRSGFLREAQITSTPTTVMERFMLKLYPVGSYFDPMTSTGTTTRQWSVTTREITAPNVNTMSNWSIPEQSWSVPQQNWSFPETKFSIPQTNWNIPQTNWNVPRINVRTPTCTTTYQQTRVGNSTIVIPQTICY